MREVMEQTQMLIVEEGKCHCYFGRVSLWQTEQHWQGRTQKQHPKLGCLGLEGSHHPGSLAGCSPGVWRELLSPFQHLKAYPQRVAEEPDSGRRGLAVLRWSSAAALGSAKMSQICWTVQREAGLSQGTWRACLKTRPAALLFGVFVVDFCQASAGSDQPLYTWAALTKSFCFQLNWLLGLLYF